MYGTGKRTAYRFLAELTLSRGQNLFNLMVSSLMLPVVVLLCGAADVGIRHALAARTPAQPIATPVPGPPRGEEPMTPEEAESIRRTVNNPKLSLEQKVQELLTSTPVSRRFAQPQPDLVRCRPDGTVILTYSRMG